jgi:hypothetical protein
MAFRSPAFGNGAETGRRLFSVIHRKSAIMNLATIHEVLHDILLDLFLGLGDNELRRIGNAHHYY